MTEGNLPASRRRGQAPGASLAPAAPLGVQCGRAGADFTGRGQEDPLETTSRPSGVPGRPTEYEDATARWLGQTVEFLMVESDPLYAQLRPEQIDGLAGTAVLSGTAGESAVTQVHTVAAGSTDVSSVISGDFEDLETAVADIAYQRLEQTMRAYFALIVKVTQQSGNVVDAHGDAAEALLAMLEKMDMQFDEDGTPAIQMVVSPADSERVRGQLDALTPSSTAGSPRSLSAKREAYCATRRRRRLPRHCY